MEDVLVVKNLIWDEDIIKKENYYLLASTVLLGVLGNVLFYNKPFGISITIFLFAFYSIFICNLKMSIKFEIGFDWILSVPILLLSTTYFIFSNEIFKVLNFLGIPILVIAQTTLITRKNLYKWHKFMFIGDILYGFIFRIFTNISKPFKLIVQTIIQRTNIKKQSNLYKVFIGLCISLPLVIVVIVLLSSADKVFENFMGRIPDLFIDVNLGEITLRGIFILIITICSFSYIWSFKTANKAERTILPDKEFSKRIFDPIIVVTILAVINVIYVFFTLIQFTYLFGSISFDLPQNFTYAEYARRGFFELIIVTLINLSILLVNLNLTKLTGTIISRVLRILNSLLIVCTLIMLISAHLRMYLYENTYGYTYLRVLTHAFMVFIFILLALTFYKVWNEKIPLLKAFIIVSLFSYVVINFVNIDIIIVKNNIERYHLTEKIDVQYLSTLSYDAVPELIKLISDKDETVALQIQNYLYLKREQLNKNDFWQSFNISEEKARKALRGLKLSHEPKLREIRVD